MTPKQKKFIKEYLIDLNATQAAIRAGYSKDTAKEIGSKLLTKVDLQEAIQKAMDERSKRTEITADMVLKELALLGFSRIRKYTEWGPRGVKLKSSDNLTDEEEACVAEVSETMNGLKFKLHDKKGALELIGRHLGMFNDKLQLEGGVVIISGDDKLEN